MTKYEIKRVDYLSDELRTFLKTEMCDLADRYDNVFDPNYCAIEKMLQSGVFFVCYRDGEITGIHLSWLLNSSLDINVKILQQQIFYVKPKSGRTAYHLFKKYVDFGRSNAHHIITMIGRHTNVKPSTLKRWGFEELETLYRMKV